MKKLYDYIGKAEVFIVKTALAIITALVFATAIARTIGHPISWAVDVATFLFAWCVFLSADMAMRNDKLVSIELVVSRLPVKAQFYLKIMNQILIILFLAVLIGFGLWLSYTTRLRTYQGIPGFSYTWVTLSVPVGCMLMLSTTIVKIKEQIARGYQSVQTTESNKEFL
ncbi:MULTISPECIES: TRAP transporter small permease [Paenibacillus]|uniref:Tripartite tricarboxylate transporter family receptor n=1 Tax=Paenibacillus naphthalenovorans TaxID=162209 RepID=A0A0U2VHZ2_9BACL|nr:MULTISPECIES: TRAP transporter small permease [Paenibacillus]ALS23043.1 tripartite tricarboxylate transporter family receptor [Paenibacillus naphthalenovorans]NTZ17356.1 TRAP transporter small permease [Paenibacillus sp. JMULE4]GCL71896.1 TRAP transporter small permease [Paenibacillus naphthalenovorans]